MGNRFERRVPIAKIDDDRRMVYGWAYVTQDEHGADVTDHSGQFTSIAEIEKAAESFMEVSRVGGAVHKYKAGGVRHSLVITDEVASILGIVSKQRGWFIGVHVADDDAWGKVKDGTYQAFSIAGDATVEVIDDAA